LWRLIAVPEYRRELLLFWLVACSAVFYAAWSAKYLTFLVCLMTVNYCIARWLTLRPYRAILALGIGINLAALGYFKYANFFSSSNSISSLERMLVLLMSFCLWVVDSQALYWVRHIDEGSSRVRKFVDAMIAAPYGVYVPSCCQRLIKLELTRRLATAECFVLGSSHQMQLRGNIGGRCRHTANLAVYSGAYEDLVTLLYAAIESGSSKTIFVGVDPGHGTRARLC
jgi:hypothetical protein